MSETPRLPDPEADTRWVLALYGATMLSIQILESAIASVYLLANYDPSDMPKPAKRQLTHAFRRSWSAFQQGTARMKLNDAARGIKHELNADLYENLDRFLAGPRAQLAHRFLVERLGPPDAATLRASDEPLSLIRFKPGTVLELLEASLTAERLSRALFDRADELRSTLPQSPDAPPELREFMERLARAAMYKEFPEPLNRPDESGHA
jgi:hypothetical protein